MPRSLPPKTAPSPTPLPCPSHPSHPPTLTPPPPSLTPATPPFHLSCPGPFPQGQPLTPSRPHAAQLGAHRAQCYRPGNGHGRQVRTSHWELHDGKFTLQGSMLGRDHMSIAKGRCQLSAVLETLPCYRSNLLLFNFPFYRSNLLLWNLIMILQWWLTHGVCSRYFGGLLVVISAVDPWRVQQLFREESIC